MSKDALPTRLPAASVTEFAKNSQMTVPAGWTAHLATVHTRASLTGRRFLVRVGTASVVSVFLALTVAPAWLLAAPVLALVSLGIAHGQARRALAAALPTGSVASTEVLDDRLVSRNAGGTREIRFDQVRSVDVRGDVVLLTLASVRGTMLIARALIPDDLLERLRR